MFTVRGGFAGCSAPLKIRQVSNYGFRSLILGSYFLKSWLETLAKIFKLECLKCEQPITIFRHRNKQLDVQKLWAPRSSHWLQPILNMDLSGFRNPSLKILTWISGVLYFLLCTVPVHFCGSPHPFLCISVPYDSSLTFFQSSYICPFYCSLQLWHFGSLELLNCICFWGVGRWFNWKPCQWFILG